MDFVCENAVFLPLLYASTLPLGGKLVADCDRTDARIYPGFVLSG
jgi:hypothetical protein